MSEIEIKRTISKFIKDDIYTSDSKLEFVKQFVS